MAETERDFTAMKETLRAQQHILQKLHAELDQEREASATAASEALDMILRLQGEKAALKMEASHYKRMMEEKMGHAEATLDLYEEIMYQKEMEIASLEFQVHAYKCKLLSLGCDLNSSEFEFPENLQSNINESNHQQKVENGQSSNVRRLSSLPPITSKNPWRTPRKRDRSPSPVPVPVPPPAPVSGPDAIPKIVESTTDQEATLPSLDLPRKSLDYAYGTLDSYWNQIKRLDEKVKVFSDCRESRGERSANLRSRRGRSCSIFSHANPSTRITCDQTEKVPSANSDKANNHHREGTRDREAVASPSSCSVNVHDVFEVPQISEKHNKVTEHGKKGLEKWNSEAENRLTKPDSVVEEMVESDVKLDVDKLKDMLSEQREIKIPSPKDMKTIVCQKKEGTMDLGCNAQAEFQKLHRRIERLERERNSPRQEITNEGSGEEQLRLLKDIHSQIKLMQTEIRSLKTKKATAKDENVSLDPLQKAMLYFWI